MKIIYHMPSLASIYAIRTIYNGYKNAFTDLGHIFITYTKKDNLEMLLKQHNPDMFFTSFYHYYLKDLNFNLISEYKKRGMVVFVSIPFWNSPFSRLRINENSSLKNDDYSVNLLKSNKFGNVYYNQVEATDARMNGFEEETGCKHYTIPLAADKMALKSEIDEKFAAGISYIGTYLPEKRNFFKRNVFPLAKKYNLKLYGQDWTAIDRTIGWVQRGGQYFNIPYLSSIRKPRLRLQDEARIYKSSTISINVHEDYQRKFGGDCNERTFKIPFCGGFEITDDVDCVKKYFKEGEELVVAHNENDWREKIDYYIKNPEERLPIIEAGQRRVLTDHTYHNRVAQIIGIYKNIKSSH